MVTVDSERARPGRATRRIGRQRWMVSLAIGALIASTTVWPTNGLVGRLHPAVLPSADGRVLLAVNPPESEVTAGGSVPLEASLAAAPGCQLFASVITWQVELRALAPGYLNTTAGAMVEYTSFAYANGSATIEAEAIGIEWCLWQVTTFSTVTSAAVEAIPPVQVGPISPSADPVPVGDPVTLSAPVSGGQGPYAVVLQFGDGQNESARLGSAGTVSFHHQYGDGTFAPILTVTDALGSVASATAPTPILVAPALAVTAAPSVSHPEVGRPFGLTASVVGGFPPYTVVWSDSQGDQGTGATWSVTPRAAGELAVNASVTDADGQRTVDPVQFTAAPPLNATLRSPVVVAEVGESVPVSLTIDGGLGPFSVAVAADPAGSRFAGSELATRTVNGSILSAATGPLWADVAVSDADGAAENFTVPVATIVDTPSLSVNLSPANLEAGSPVRCVMSVDGGVGPFAWSLLPLGSIGFSTARNGTVGPGALWAWTGSAVAAGAFGVEVRLVDATGAVVTGDATALVVPSLAVSVSPPAGPAREGSPVTVSAWVDGGAPPYRIEAEGSDGASQLANLSAPGPVLFRWEPTLPGSLTLAVSAVDGLDDLAESNWTTTVASNASAPVTPAPPASTPSSTAPTTPTRVVAGDSGVLGAFAGGLGASLGIGILVAAVWMYIRRRRPAPPSSPVPSSAAVSFLRRVLRENPDGLERETLYLLAEEEGFDAATVDTALDRWRTLGRIPTTGTDPGELVRWIAPVGSSAAEADARDEDGSGAPVSEEVP